MRAGKCICIKGSTTVVSAEVVGICHRVAHAYYTSIHVFKYCFQTSTGDCATILSRMKCDTDDS